MASQAKRRVLLVSDLWQTHPNGPARVIQNLMRELESHGHSVELLEPGQFFSIPFPLYPEARLPLFAFFGVRRVILGRAHDDIHLVTEGLLGWFARSVCKKHGIPFTTAMHGRTDLYATMWLGKRMGDLVRSLFTRFHGAAMLTLVLTNDLQEVAHSIGIARTALWPLGVDPLFQTQGTCPTTLEKPVFMYFGRVSSEKSIEEFLRLGLPGTKLVIGDGPDRKDLEAKYPSARFVGSQTGEALVSWLACADAFVMPSKTEVFPLVVVESLAAGVPVAAYNVAGPREFIKEGVNGYLDDDLARAAKRCLSLSRAACRESVQAYTWKASAERFLELTASARSGTSG